METPVHVELPPKVACFSTYKSTLHLEFEDPALSSGILDHPQRCRITPTEPAQRLTVELYHGRLNPDQVMDDWGFTGPQFSCAAVTHEPERIELAGSDPHSLTLARRLGLETRDDAILVAYHDDMLLVPQFRGGQAAYFGDLSITTT